MAIAKTRVILGLVKLLAECQKVVYTVVGFLQSESVVFAVPTICGRGDESEGWMNIYIPMAAQLL